MNRTLSLLAALALALAATSCQDPAVARRKAAQASANRYFEYVKVGDYRSAYDQTLTKRWKGAMPFDRFEMYRKGLAAQTGEMKSYTLVDYSARPDSTQVKLGYALETANYPTPVVEILAMVEEDGEWRIDSLDLQRPKLESDQPSNREPAPFPFKGKGSAAKNAP